MIRSLLLFISLTLFFTACTKGRSGIEQVRKFAELRQKGEADEAFELLTDKSKNQIGSKRFNDYCFKYRIASFEVAPEEGGFYKIDYSYYDKRFKGGELFTFYMNKNREYIRVSNGKIVFPQPYFLDFRKNLEKGDMESAKNALRKMFELSPGQPEARETVDRMELEI